MPQTTAPHLPSTPEEFEEYQKALYKSVGLVGATSAKPIKKPKPVLSGHQGFIVPYNKVSMSAKALSKALGLHRDLNPLGTNHNITKFTFLNWGMAKLNEGITSLSNVKILNAPPGVALTRNKLKLFKKIADSADPARIPQFFESLDDAMSAVKAGEVVFGRKFTGSCGTDIVTFEQNPDRFNTSDFWVVYKKKKSEFRIHIFKKAGVPVVVDRQQKTLRKTHPVTGEVIDKANVNFMIRNHKNGFIFQRNDIKVPSDVETQALKAFAITGLDFGAVDVIWNEHEGKAYVLEINTAPGLEGTTLETYVREFKNLGIGSEDKTA